MISIGDGMMAIMATVHCTDSQTADTGHRHLIADPLLWNTSGLVRGRAIGYMLSDCIP